MSVRSRSLWFLTFIGVLVLFPWLGATHLSDEDEGYFGSAALEMWTRGDWIVPMFNGEMFGHKPPFMYWMMMLGFEAFGANEFSARVFSAVFGLAAALVTYLLGERLFNSRTGLIAGLVMLTSVFANIVARAATPDSFLTFFSTAAIYCFVRQYFTQQAAALAESAPGRPAIASPVRISFPTAVAMAFLMGLGTLVKGPVGIILPMAVIGLFLLWMTPQIELPVGANRWSRWRHSLRRFGPSNFLATLWRMRPITTLAVTICVAGPWYLAVSRATDGRFLQEFFGVHHLHRFASPMDSHHGSLLYYVMTILIGMFPWSIFAMPIGLRIAARLRTRVAAPQLVLLLCWAGVYIVAFSLAATKLPNYVLPAYPALALLVGVAINDWLTREAAISLNWLRAAFSIPVAVGGVLLIAALVVSVCGQQGEYLLGRYQVDVAVQSRLLYVAVLGLPLLAGGFLAFWLLDNVGRGAALKSVGVLSVVNCLVLWGVVAPGLDGLQTPQLLVEHGRKCCHSEDAVLAQFGCFRPSMVFYWRQPIRMLASTQAVAEFLHREPHGFIVTTTAGMAKFSPEISSEVAVLDQRSQFPKKGEIVMLRRTDPVTEHVALPKRSLARHPY
ncbi:ArnT family glycosyltransferase [Planctomicrobium piriforme]|uniref:Dolichyl-phosphate-mannose-protein mannosyltransferase n=1 Tax=Planctomicrobium piriforme TaxID=1576369 RepID=A0A1I3BE21_9PLAN|nr:glycosyltransferase family 39 protein [Planctomicrobium piriforme]SFH60518.1 Dolichyl-phosphate-mannose-protein mannosyltransferase [Planctomicrobium piriforme]